MQKMNLQPLSVFLVKNGQGGDLVLFRYPYKVSTPRKSLPVTTRPLEAKEIEAGMAESMSSLFLPPVQRHKYYKLPDNGDDAVLTAAGSIGAAGINANASVGDTSAGASGSGPANEAGGGWVEQTLCAENLPEFPSKVLSNMFAVHSQLCDKKFELKINDVRFVGHPLSLRIRPGEARNFARDIKSNLTMFQVVFALRDTADYSTVEIFHDLSQQIGVAIHYEERRCGYLSKEANILWLLQEEVVMAGSSDEDQINLSPYALALQAGKSSLAKSLKIIFEEVSGNGVCYERINNNIEISFCMPQLLFRRLNPCLEVEPESIWKCLEAVRPYHGILLLYEERELLDKLPLDATPTLKKMLGYASPTKSFRTIASDSDLSLLHVFQLAGHLLYWGLAIIIYPICETNVYAISPKIENLLTPVVAERFADKFPGENLVSCLATFSLPSSVALRTAHILNPEHIQLLTKIIIWMLQQHLLIQIHTYVTLILNADISSKWEDPVEKIEQEIDQPQAPKVLELVDDDSDAEVTEDVETILGAFQPADQAEILKITHDKNELAKFAQVAIFMNGKYHIEEIMYHTNCRRAHLLQIIDKFRNIIVRNEHEDPALTMYYEPIRRNT